MEGIKKPRISSRFCVGVDPVEIRENPRPSACKEKKTHFQIFNSQSIYWLLTAYILSNSPWFSIFSTFFLLFLQFFCKKILTGHKLKKTLSGPFLGKKIVDLVGLFLLQVNLLFSKHLVIIYLFNWYNLYPIGCFERTYNLRVLIQ